MKYKVIVPPTKEQGSYKTIVKGPNYRKEALWDYNHCREHDGLDHVKRMPNGTYYMDVYDWDIQADYGHGFETVTTETTHKEALLRLKEYRGNEPGITFRIKKVKDE
jgi:hypothetical protein